MEPKGEKAKRPKRRNSILKDVVPSENLLEEKICEKSFQSKHSLKKRVSFADTTSIKEFLAIKDAKTEWNCTYEVPVVHDSSSISEINKSICQPSISQNCAPTFQTDTFTGTYNDVKCLETSQTESEKKEVFEVSEFLMSFLGMKPQSSVIENKENINDQYNDIVISSAHVSEKDPHQFTGNVTCTTSADIDFTGQVDKHNFDLWSKKSRQNAPAVSAPVSSLNDIVLNDSIIDNKESPMESTRLGNLNCTMMNTFGMDITNCDQGKKMLKNVSVLTSGQTEFELPCIKDIDKFSTSNYNLVPNVNLLQHNVTVMADHDMEMTTGVLQPFQIIIPATDMDVSNETIMGQSALTFDKSSQGLTTFIADDKMSVPYNNPEAFMTNEINKNIKFSTIDSDKQTHNVTKKIKYDIMSTFKAPQLDKVLHSKLPADEHAVEKTICTNYNISMTCANQQLLQASNYSDDMEFTCKGPQFKKKIHSKLSAEEQAVEKTLYTNDNISMTCVNQQLLQANNYNDNMEFTRKGHQFIKKLHSNLHAEEHAVEKTLYTNDNISMTCANQEFLQDNNYNDDMEFTCKGPQFKKQLHSNLLAEKHEVEETLYTNDNISMTCENQQLLQANNYSDKMEFTCKGSQFKKKFHSNLPAEEHAAEETLCSNDNISMTCANQEFLQDNNYNDDMEYTCKEPQFKNKLHSDLRAEEQAVKETLYTNDNLSMTCANQQLLQASNSNDNMEFTCKGPQVKNKLHSDLRAHAVEETLYTNNNISMTCANQQLLQAKNNNDGRPMEFTCIGPQVKNKLHSDLRAEEHAGEETLYTNDNISMTCANQQLLQANNNNDGRPMEFTCKGPQGKNKLHSDLRAEEHAVEETLYTNESISITCANQQLQKGSNHNDDMEFTCKGPQFKLHSSLSEEHNSRETANTKKNMSMIFNDPLFQGTKVFNQNVEMSGDESPYFKSLQSLRREHHCVEKSSCSLENSSTVAMHSDNMCKSECNMELTCKGSVDLGPTETKYNNNKNIFMATFGDNPPTSECLYKSNKLLDGNILLKESDSTHSSTSLKHEVPVSMPLHLTEPLMSYTEQHPKIAFADNEGMKLNCEGPNCNGMSDISTQLIENTACASSEDMELTHSSAKHRQWCCENETNLELQSHESLQLYQSKNTEESAIIIPISNDNVSTIRSLSENGPENEIITETSISSENIPSSCESSAELELHCKETLIVFKQTNLLKSTEFDVDLKDSKIVELSTSYEKQANNASLIRENHDDVNKSTCDFSSSRNFVSTSPVLQENGIGEAAKSIAGVDACGASANSSQHDKSENFSKESSVIFNYEQHLHSACYIPNVDENEPLHLQQRLEGLLTSPITNRQNLCVSVSLLCENIALANTNLDSSISSSVLKNNAKTSFGKCEEIANDLSSVRIDKYRLKRLNQSSHCEEPNAKIIAIKNSDAQAMPVFSSKNLSFQSCEKPFTEQNHCHQSSYLVERAGECEEEMLDEIALDLVDEEQPFSPKKIQIDKAQLKIRELLKKINEFADISPPFISDIVMESFSSASPDFLLPLKDVSKHLLEEDMSRYDCEELRSELSAFSTQLTNRILKASIFNELKENLINQGQLCSDRNLLPTMTSGKLNNSCQLCLFESLEERKEISTTLNHKFIIVDFKSGRLEMQLQNRPFHIFLDLSYQGDHCTIVRADWKPQHQDLKNPPAKLAMAKLGHCITTEVANLKTMTFCEAVDYLDFVVKAYEKVVTLLKEILAAQSFHITSYTDSGMTVSFVNAKAHLKVCVHIELYYDESKDNSFPLIKTTPKVLLGNLREKTLELEIMRVPDGPNKLSDTVRTLASFVQQMAPRRL